MLQLITIVGGGFLFFWICFKLEGFETRAAENGGESPAGNPPVKKPLALVGENFADNSVELIIEGQSVQRKKRGGCNEEGDVLYVGGLATVDGDPTFHKFQILHFFPDGVVRLLRSDSTENEVEDHHIEKLRPVLEI